MHRGRQRPKFKTKSYGTTRYTKNKYTVKSTVSGTAVAGLEGGMTQEDEFQTSIGGTTEDQQLPTTALFEKYAVINAMDLQMGFVDHSSNVPKRGWLINIQTVILPLHHCRHWLGTLNGSPGDPPCICILLKNPVCTLNAS